MLAAVDGDPFRDDRFVKFISQMIEKEWDPETVRIAVTEYERLSAELAKIRSGVAKHEAIEAEINERITAKRGRITSLERQLRAMAKNLERSASSQSSRQTPDFTSEALHVDFTEEQTTSVGDGETALLVHFGEFHLGDGVIGEEHTELRLVVDFLENLGVTTDPVDSLGGAFNADMLFTCKNDLILRTFIEKSVVPVRLCRSPVETKTEIGKAELCLLPFVQGINKFTSSAHFTTRGGTEVGDVTFEAGLFRPLVVGEF
jgi:hypothetical protein